MLNPFRGASETFYIVLAAMLGLIVIDLAAGLGPTWFAIAAVAVILVAMAMRMVQFRALRRQSRELHLRSAPAHVGSSAERRVLVVANDTLGEEGLLEVIEKLGSAPHTQVLVLAPALISPGARLTGAIDRSLVQARVRLGAALDLVGRHLNVAGEISEAEPLEAVADSVAAFAADEIVIATRRGRVWRGLEPRLAGLVRERFAVPVRHLVVDPGAVAFESDRDTEADYRQESYEIVSRKGMVVLQRALGGAGILAAMLMSMVALVQSSNNRQAGPTSTVKLAAATTPAKVIDVSVLPESKLAPDGRKHDAFTVTQFDVKVGQPLKLRIDNTDNQPHSITAPAAGVDIVAQPGTHVYTLVVTKAGKFLWFCRFPCDTAGKVAGWGMRNPGYMSGYITAS